MFRKLKAKKVQATTLQNGSDTHPPAKQNGDTQASASIGEPLSKGQPQEDGAPATEGHSLGTKHMPDYLLDRDAVLNDKVDWRHGKAPDYSAANTNFIKGRTKTWPAQSLEDLVSNLVKNWEKEASYKLKTEDWRTIDPAAYQFSCNGGRKHSAEEMVQIGTYNALIGEAAFYSAKHTGFEESHEVFRKAMPTGFPWEVTEVYSGPPVVAFKWRHWGKMTGKLVCPIGPDTKLEADPNNQHVEIFGMCTFALSPTPYNERFSFKLKSSQHLNVECFGPGVAQLDASFRITDLEVFYDPHELMSSLVDARNLSYTSPGQRNSKPGRSSLDMRGIGRVMDTFASLEDVPTRESFEERDEFSEADGDRYSDSASSGLPSDAALLNALATNGIAYGRSRPLPASRCPYPR